MNVIASFELEQVCSNSSTRTAGFGGDPWLEESFQALRDGRGNERESRGSETAESSSRPQLANSPQFLLTRMMMMIRNNGKLS